jgi:hypothetical protein
MDGHDGDSSVIADSVASGAQIVVRKRGYRWLDHPLVQAAIAHEPVATMTTRESQVSDEVFDLPQMLLEDGTTPVRLLLTRRAWKRGAPISVGKVVGDWVYEQFVTTLPADGFLATDPRCSTSSKDVVPSKERWLTRIAKAIPTGGVP